ncbi:hypothetical protein JW868_03130, partial [Candidatus Woesearchaeota archaeon]|nr:hypothetical protein [Candidatus Woesearchaeota archaeon]
MYATYANEYVGDFDRMVRSYKLVMQIFDKYHFKIKSAIRKMPDFKSGCGIHARFHPDTLDELSDDWGHHQLDIFGLFLYKTGDLIQKGHRIITTARQKEIIQDIIQYLYTVKWETVPDNGIWEEGAELHSSSIGAVLAGLTMWHDEGHYEYKYKHKINLGDVVPVSERYLEDGRKALSELLPRESASKEQDLSQLSLIWPYNIISREKSLEVINRVEKNLVRERGVIRYTGDKYFNSNPESLAGNEAQWPLGISWLSIAHSKMAQRCPWQGCNFDESLGYLQKAKQYIQQVESMMVDGGKLPELFFNGKPNANVPLAWAQSLHIVAVKAYMTAIDNVEHHFNKKIEVDLRVK